MTQPGIPSPLPVGERISAIDVLRGFSLFGIVVVNAWFFGLPLAVASGQTDLAAQGADGVAWFVVTGFFSFKFISIFSVLFGFGIAMQRARLLQRTGRAAGFLARRMAILAAFGLLHAGLLWYGDILFQYALVGMIMILLIQVPTTIRLWLGVACLAVSMTGVFLFSLLALFAPAMSDTPDLTLRGLEAMQAANFDPAHPQWIPAEIAANREGPWTDAFLFRIVVWGFATVIFFLNYGWHVLGLVLLGSYFHDIGLFNADRRPLLGRLAIWGVAIGLPVELALAGLIQFGNPDVIQRAAISAVHDVASATLAIGLIGVVGRACAAKRMPGAKTLAAVGRMSLSAYLLESVCFVALMSFWGFAQFGRLGEMELLLAAILVYCVVAALCVGWSRRFRMGPLEWLWRVGSYLGVPRASTPRS
ncbi:MAG: DUF418 domain-containing protein [Planctomycetia bacterium]|nr:DUF418 domain-containing protein [Planctomycetia bacterium]